MVGQRIVKGIDDYGIMLRRLRVEVFLVNRLTLRCLHLLVLRIMVEHYQINEERLIYGRKFSAEDFESGGVTQKNILQVSNQTHWDLLLRFYTRRAIGITDNSIPKFTDNTNIARIPVLREDPNSSLPWFLDKNPITLRESLEGLKKIILKFGTTKETLAYKYPAFFKADSPVDILQKHSPRASGTMW